MANPAGVFSLFYLIAPFHGPSAATWCGGLCLPARKFSKCETEMDFRRTHRIKSMARVTIQPGNSPSPTGSIATRAQLHIRYNSGRRVDSEGGLFVPSRF